MMQTVTPPLIQSTRVPDNRRPIVIIGTGGIVENAHLPAYQRLGFEVRGVYDRNPEAAQRVAARFDVPAVYASLQEALGEANVVYDLAVPASAVLETLEQLPAGSPVLIQKPFGRNLDEAKRIVQLCRSRNLFAAVNFQLRFSPNMLALRDALERGLLGQVTDLEVRINVFTPWHLWDFLKGLPRHELVYHSIHYLDLIRLLLGEPKGVFCRSLRHPQLPDYADTRSTIILDYGEDCRCSLLMNHAHDFGQANACSILKVEGTKGAAIAQMGVNLYYPEGKPDTLSIAQRGASEWNPVPLRGSWFNEAFEGPMSNLQCALTEDSTKLVSPVSDAIKTMALVEACYQSANTPGTPIPDVEDSK